MAGLAIAKPKPRSNGAHSAKRISLNFIFDLKQVTMIEYIFLLRITIKKYKMIM